MAEQLNKLIDNLKEFWSKLEPRTKRIVLWSTAGFFALAIGLTVYINLPKAGYRAIFPGMTNQEVSEVYAVLLEMGVQPEIDKTGSIMVPQEQWDNLQYQLSAQGYPKTTLAYDTFSNMSGFTTTEFEKRVALTYQLQDRIQSTLKRWNGIADAAVIINIPESSNFVWSQAQQEAATASVTITTRLGHSLAPEQVSAIKNHVAASVPKLTASQVRVVDAATGVEPPSLEEQYGGYNAARLDFERKVEKAIEDNVKRLLVPTYGYEGVTAVAKVSIDYDKMVTERRQVLPQEDDGQGVLTHIDEYYTVGGNQIAGGLAGENDNTDIPEYPNLNGLNGNDITVFDRSMDYDVGYVLTQIEKGEPLLKEATLSVIVNDDNFTTDKESLLIDLISKSVNIQPYNIMVANMDFRTVPAGTSPTVTGFDWATYWPWIAGGALLLLIIIALIIFFVMRSRGRRRAAQIAAAAEKAALEMQMDLEQQIANHKLMIRNEAMSTLNVKDDALTTEIRDFAEHNPEVTANLIRSLMKEER